jgi:hypothetical protein
MLWRCGRQREDHEDVGLGHLAEWPGPLELQPHPLVVPVDPGDLLPGPELNKGLTELHARRRADLGAARCSQPRLGIREVEVVSALVQAVDVFATTGAHRVLRWLNPRVGRHPVRRPR